MAQNPDTTKWVWNSAASIFNKRGFEDIPRMEIHQMRAISQINAAQFTGTGNLFFKKKQDEAESCNDLANPEDEHPFDDLGPGFCYIDL